MAPEVFTRNMTDGHGRAADIWSVGCVVVEMASGEVIFESYIFFSSIKSEPLCQFYAPFFIFMSHYF